MGRAYGLLPGHLGQLLLTVRFERLETPLTQIEK